MSIPLFFPPVRYVKRLRLERLHPRDSHRDSHGYSHVMTLESLCHKAGVPCRGTGLWIQRKVKLVPGSNIDLTAEAGDWGKVQVRIPGLLKNISRKDARLAVAALAYALHDLVAKQSLLGNKWAQIKAPPGRPCHRQALTNKERQRRFREKKSNSP